MNVTLSVFRQSTGDAVIDHCFRNMVIMVRLRLLISDHPLVVAGLIGAIGAFLTIGFREAIFLIEYFIFGRGDSLVRIATALLWWQRLIAPAIGGVAAGILLWIANRWKPVDRDSDYMEAIALGSGELGFRHSLFRSLSSLATVASGGAIGREGPMVQLAALGGSVIGRWFKLDVSTRRLYVACGAAAGIATAYNAPIAAALFIAEVVLNSVSMASVGPLLVAAFTANLVVRKVAGYTPTYHMPTTPNANDLQILVLLPLGVIAGMIAPIYLAFLDYAHSLFRNWRQPLWVKLGVGGLLVGAISIISPDVWGNGYSVVDSILQGGWLVPTLFGVLFWKILAVAATTGSGAVGGIFTPTLFVGAVLGGLFSALVHYVSPDILPTAIIVAVGMGSFLAACTHAPLMSILMIFEMTQNYSLMVPLMACCVIGFVTSRSLRGRSIYAFAQSHLASDQRQSMKPDIKL